MRKTENILYLSCHNNYLHDTKPSCLLILSDKFWSRAKMSLGIPIKVLHEAEGHIITCESSTGEVYRGKLVEAEEHMNLQVISSLRLWPSKYFLDGRCNCNIPKWKYCSIGKYLPTWDSNKIHDFARNAQKCPNAQGPELKFFHVFLV